MPAANAHSHISAISAYLRRIGADQVNFRRAVVHEEIDGYKRVKASVRFNADGSVEAPEGYEPDASEQQAILGEVARRPFPNSIAAPTINLLAANLGLHPNDPSLFAFYDKSGKEILFVRQRVIHSSGKKACLPWSFWSDGEWRQMEPDGPLPLYGLSETQKYARLMIHEGEKAARFCQQMRDGTTDEARKAFEALPISWQDALKYAGHVGWCTGAANPQGTDWEPLQAPGTTLQLVCDHDQLGEDVAPRISEALRRPLTVFRFGNDFPTGFDLADPFPPELWEQVGQHRSRYHGPSFEDCMWPGTWATEPLDKGHRLRTDFVSEWWVTIRPQTFINKANPRRRYSRDEFDATVAPYSHIDRPSRLLLKKQSVQADTLAYEPGKPPGLIAVEKKHVVNAWAPSDIKPEEGDPQPFLDFMERLIPETQDRTETLRWIATLIAKPEVRMLYGLLLVSETQGVGKTTLGEKILAPLVGMHNVSFPTEKQVTDSAFNSWAVHKRLAIVNEIYAGHSAKAYNNIKSYVTDQTLTVEEKYQKPYEINNWLHLFACSNSSRALRLAFSDRRWFIPRVTEDVQSIEYWVAFNQWLADGGLSVIAAWARKFVAQHGHVVTGAHAPGSLAKQEMIEEGMSPGERIVADTLDAVREEANGDGVIILDTDLVGLIKDRLYDGRQSDKLEKPSTIRKVAKSRNWFINPVRVKVKEWGVAGGPRLICSSAELAQKTPGQLAQEGFRPADLERYQRMRG